MTTNTTSFCTLSPDELKVILKDHHLWLRSGRTQGKCANLSDAKLCGADLSDAILRGADLSYAILRGADLEGADLYGADLYGADLSYAILRGADLEGADLAGADLHGAKVSEPWKIVDGKLVQTNAPMALQTPKVVAAAEAAKVSPTEGTAELINAIRQHAAKLETAAKLTQIEHELAFKALASLPGGEHIVSALRVEATNQLKNSAR